MREPIINYDASQKNLSKVLVNSLAPKIIVKGSLFTKVFLELNYIFSSRKTRKPAAGITIFVFKKSEAKTLL